MMRRSAHAFDMNKFFCGPGAELQHSIDMCNIFVRRLIGFLDVDANIFLKKLACCYLNMAIAAVCLLFMSNINNINHHINNYINNTSKNIN
ncbi:CLUMA_CG007614, isoform A [Clunio marinus]|uniref:CLUMA_CG007614, isoform A n=1 Tax=Clunio marinus TaxID=568069 RepID=A0A1J1I1K1_9DIPT|nr:CLUMA_CG007614, isoform A [Clunio marinus]